MRSATRGIAQYDGGFSPPSIHLADDPQTKPTYCPQLPDDLWQQIAEDIYDRGDTRSLSYLNRVSRTFYLIASPLLHRQISITAKHTNLLFLSLDLDLDREYDTKQLVKQADKISSGTLYPIDAEQNARTLANLRYTFSVVIEQLPNRGETRGFLNLVQQAQFEGTGLDLKIKSLTFTPTALQQIQAQTYAQNPVSLHCLRAIALLSHIETVKIYHPAYEDRNQPSTSRNVCCTRQILLHQYINSLSTLSRLEIHNIVSSDDIPFKPGVDHVISFANSSNPNIPRQTAYDRVMQFKQLIARSVSVINGELWGSWTLLDCGAMLSWDENNDSRALTDWIEAEVRYWIDNHTRKLGGWQMGMEKQVQNRLHFKHTRLQGSYMAWDQNRPKLTFNY